MIWMTLKVNKGLEKWDLCFVIYMFLSNNPSSGNINSSNLSCLLSWCSALNSLWFDMQQDYFHKNIWFDLLTLPPGSRVCLWAKYMLPCCCKSCQLKFDMQHDPILTSLILTSAPPPKSTPGALTHAFKLKSHLIWFISIAALPTCKISAKNLDNCLNYCEI